MAFPINPDPGDEYTDEYGTTWVYAGPVNGWYRQDVSATNEIDYGDESVVAETAAALETARNIGGVPFDGTQDIDLPGVNVVGNQDTSGNAGTATALETARTIGGVSFDGTANINLPGVNTAGTQDTSGNAGTATKLSSARTLSVTGAITGTVDSDLESGFSLASTYTPAGVAGQILTSNGPTVAPTFQDAVAAASGLGITSSTVNASGTGNTFASLPSGLRRVNLTFNNLSTNSNVRIGLRIGGSGGLVTTGYNLASCYFGGAQAGYFSTNDSLFGATGWNSSSNIYNGKVEITRVSSLATTTNVVYFLQLTMNLSGYNYIHMVQGHVTLPTELQQVRMMPESGNFDAGIIEIDYLS